MELSKEEREEYGLEPWQETFDGPKRLWISDKASRCIKCGKIETCSCDFIWVLEPRFTRQKDKDDWYAEQRAKFVAGKACPDS